MDQKKALHVLAYEHIKNMVLEGKMEYGEIYSETKIAKEIGISRTPVRDAIQYLSQEKYIDILPNKGFCLHKMGIQDFVDTNQIRTAIEGYCGREIAQKAHLEETKETFDLLESFLKQQKEALEQESVTAFFEADMQFHIQLVSHIANRELNNLFGTYMYRMRNLALHSLHVLGRMEKTYQEHLEIFENMKQGNMIQTYESIVYHMESPRNISIDED